ncbi:MAG TPA: XrtA system polysaccharide chain length determinant [Stellaceae bacterium]|nr:XrtA system polysaccharide chain length determinant [Stellaceae bacterium]
MEQGYRLFWQTLATAWRRRWLLVAAAWGVCLLGWAAVALIPDSYESDARIYVDTDAILTPLLKGLAVDTATVSQLEIMQKTLLSRPNLDKLIDATPLNLSVTGPVQRQSLIRRLMTEIKVTSEGRNLFTISYRSRDPHLAHDVVAALLNIFIDRATGTNRADMENAQRFIGSQIASYEAQLRAAEQRRAAFLRKYMDILPLDNNGGVSRLDNARVAVANLAGQVKDAMARRTALQQEVALTSPVITEATIGGGGAAATSPQARLAAAEEKLDELRSQYTEQHPDVIAARRAVAALKAEIARTPQTNKPTTPAPGSFALPNPVYEQLKMRIIEADATISALQSQLDAARKDLARMENLARAAPEVAAQYQGLDRDYQVLRHNYEELLARREASNITEAADTSADKVRLRIVDPPQIPSVPVAPKRLLLVSLVLLAGLGAAAGLAVLLAQSDRSIGEPGQLRDFGRPVLGGVSLIPSPRRRLVLYPQAVGITLAFLVLIAVYGGLAAELAVNHKVLL